MPSGHPSARGMHTPGILELSRRNALLVTYKQGSAIHLWIMIIESPNFLATFGRGRLEQRLASQAFSQIIPSLKFICLSLSLCFYIFILSSSVALFTLILTICHFTIILVDSTFVTNQNHEEYTCPISFTKESYIQIDRKKEKKLRNLYFLRGCLVQFFKFSFQ